MQLSLESQIWFFSSGPEGLGHRLEQSVTLYHIFISAQLTRFPRTVICSRTLWQDEWLLMAVGKIEHELFWGYGTVSATAKPLCCVISTTPHSLSPFGSCTSTWEWKRGISQRSWRRNWVTIFTDDSVDKCVIVCQQHTSFWKSRLRFLLMLMILFDNYCRRSEWYYFPLQFPSAPSWFLSWPRDSKAELELFQLGSKS